MNYNTGNPTNYTPDEVIDRVHTTADGKTRNDTFRVARVATYYGNQAVFGYKWMQKRQDWSKGAVFIEYFSPERGDTF